MGISRRMFVAALLGACTAPAMAADGDFFKDLISDIKDDSERKFYESHRDDARWDGKYYYDRENNKRYTRDEWKKEMNWRYKEEKAGRDWRKERYSKDDRRDNRRDDRRDAKRDDRKDDRRDAKRDDRKDDRRDAKRDDRKDDRRDAKRDDRRDARRDKDRDDKRDGKSDSKDKDDKKRRPDPKKDRRDDRKDDRR